jgi:hypothetical protein
MKFQLNQNKGKENREFVWCTLCRTKGHHKNEFPTFAQYLEAGFWNTLPTGGVWCEICKTHGHDPCHFPLIQKYQIVPESTFCNFYKFVGHEDKDCITTELIK